MSKDWNCENVDNEGAVGETTCPDGIQNNTSLYDCPKCNEGGEWNFVQCETCKNRWIITYCENCDYKDYVTCPKCNGRPRPKNEGIR